MLMIYKKLRNSRLKAEEPVNEYDRYLADRNLAYDDSLQSHANLDKWLLTFSSGGFVLGAGIKGLGTIGNHDVLSGIAISLFALAIILSIYGKVASYIQCEQKRTVIEQIYSKYPDYTNKVHEIEYQKQSSQNVRRIKIIILISALFAFGVLTMTASVITSQYHKGVQVEENRSPAGKNTPTVTSKTSKRDQPQYFTGKNARSTTKAAASEEGLILGHGNLALGALI